MLFARLVDRVRADFMAMPEMEVTLPQAVRLWNLGLDDCRYVLDALVDAGFLRWTTAGTVVRADVRASSGNAPFVPVLATRVRRA